MKNRKRILSLGLAVCCIVGSFSININKVSAAEYWPEQPEIESPCAIVMEASTGTVLYEKNSHEQHYPASITKIMTTLLALENSSLDETVTFSSNAIYDTMGSGIARDVDEQMTMEQCLYGVMLESANECAYAVAEHVGGTMEQFVDMMNERATELGCTDTHFNNSHGLTDENHYTSCYDMALIAREAYKNETFRIITSTPTYQIPPTNKHEEITYLQNHNEMLHAYKTRGQYLYEYCVGGKTGYTDAANSTLVTYAQKDGMTLICVIMNTISPAQWTDSIALYNYYFDNFGLYNVADNETRLDNGTVDTGSLNTNSAFVKLDADASIVLPKSADFMEAIPQIVYDNTSEDVLATVQYTFADHVVGGADIMSTGVQADTFDFDNVENDNATEAETKENHKIQINVKIIILVLLGLVALGVIIWLIKKLMDNVYIIKHKYFEKAQKDKRYKTIKKKYRSKRRKRRRK